MPSSTPGRGPGHEEREREAAQKLLAILDSAPSVSGDGEERGEEDGATGFGWSAPAEAIQAAWRAVESLEDHPPIHRNVIALAVSAAMLTQESGRQLARLEARAERAVAIALASAGDEGMVLVRANSPEIRQQAREILDSVQPAASTQQLPGKSLSREPGDREQVAALDGALRLERLAEERPI